MQSYMLKNSIDKSEISMMYEFSENNTTAKDHLNLRGICVCGLRANKVMNLV